MHRRDSPPSAPPPQGCVAPQAPNCHIYGGDPGLSNHATHMPPRGDVTIYGTKSPPKLTTICGRLYARTWPLLPRALDATNYPQT